VATAKPHSSLDLVRRSILPSVTSVTVCLFAGIVTVLIGILGAASNQGSTIGFQPIRVSFMSDFSRMLSRGTTHDILSIALWILILSFVFAVLEFLFGSYATFHGTAKKKKVSADVNRQQRMMELTWLLKRMFWRVIVGLIATAVAVLLVQLTTWVSGTEKASILGLSFVQNAGHMIISCIIWAVVYYAALVFVRLYTFRTSLL
jgi:hypothetical protein